MKERQVSPASKQGYLCTQDDTCLTPVPPSPKRPGQPIRESDSCTVSTDRCDRSLGLDGTGRRLKRYVEAQLEREGVIARFLMRVGKGPESAPPATLFFPLPPAMISRVAGIENLAAKTWQQKVLSCRGKRQRGRHDAHLIAAVPLMTGQGSGSRQNLFDCEIRADQQFTGTGQALGRLRRRRAPPLGGNGAAGRARVSSDQWG